MAVSAVRCGRAKSYCDLYRIDLLLSYVGVRSNACFLVQYGKVVKIISGPGVA